MQTLTVMMRRKRMDGSRLNVEVRQTVASRGVRWGDIVHTQRAHVIAAHERGAWHQFHEPRLQQCQRFGHVYHPNCFTTPFGNELYQSLECEDLRSHTHDGLRGIEMGVCVGR